MGRLVARTRLCVGVVGMEDFYGPLFDTEVFGAEKAVMKVLIFKGNYFSGERRVVKRNVIDD